MDIDNPEQVTVYDALRQRASTHASRPLLAVPPLADRDYYPAGIEFDYADVLGRVDALADRYAGAGYGHGHRVALLLANRPEYLMHMLALNRVGASVVPVNQDYRDDESRYLLDHSEAELIVTLPERMADMKRVVATTVRRRPVVDVTASSDRLPPAERAAKPGTPDRNTEAALMYTSGTTGRPKGCILSNEYHFVLGQSYLRFGGMASIEPGRERLYNPLPLFHMNPSILSFMCMLLSGGCLIIPDRFHPRSWWQEVADSRATIIHYLGVVPPMLLNQPVSPIERDNAVRFGVGAGVEPQLHGVFEQRFGFPLLELWGMTEAGCGLISAQEPREIDTRAFGRPGNDLKARVVDDNGNDAVSGATGELWVQRNDPNPRRGFFSGYFKNTAATNEAWADGDWLRTGDIVTQGDDGMLYFFDRKKNIVRRSGENIAAAEIEALLQSHDEVAQVAVMAAPDEVREEEVLACIVQIEGATADEALARRLFDYCMQRLAYYKAPGWIVFRDSLPTTGTQKVQKARLFGKDEDPRQQPNTFDFRPLKSRHYNGRESRPHSRSVRGNKPG